MHSGPAVRTEPLLSVGCRGGFLLGPLGLVVIEQAFEECDGGGEVVIESDEQVDVVVVFPAVETVGEVVARVDGGAHFAAAGAEEAEVPFTDFGGRPRTAERGDGDGHGEVVADSAQQFGGDHGLLRGAVFRCHPVVSSRRGRLPFASGVA